MSIPSIKYSTSPPSANEFVTLRQLVGWGTLNESLAQASLECSLFTVSAYLNQELIAMGRVVGDGYMYFYIQDVIVHPKYQGLGLGEGIMEHIESYLASNCRPGATTGLFAAQGKEGFYRKYDYMERCGDILGKGMCKFTT